MFDDAFCDIINKSYVWKKSQVQILTVFGRVNMPFVYYYYYFKNHRTEELHPTNTVNKLIYQYCTL